MLGLKLPQLSEAEEKALFPSVDRYYAYQQIQAETYPAKHKRAFKKGITRTIVEKNVLSEAVLTNKPTLYLGSGKDIAYLLALGVRKGYLIDPLFKEVAAVTDLEAEITKMKPDAALQRSENEIRFNFNFGHGDETTQVTLLPVMYGREPIQLPKDIGLLVTFASQGPEGAVAIGEDIMHNMATTAYILEENRLQTRQNGETITQEIGNG